MRDYISDSLFPYFEKAGILLRFKEKEQIYFQGDYAKDFYFIKKGKVRVYLLNRHGHELTIEIVDRGRIFGESSFSSRSQRLTSIEAITQVELVACDYEALLPYLTQSPQLLTTVFFLLAKTSKNLSHQVRRLCFLDAKARIADFLLWMTEEPGPEIAANHTTLFYTHQEVAECVNLQRVTVTRLLNEFQDEGLIALKYKAISILDRDALTIYVESQL